MGARGAQGAQTKPLDSRKGMLYALICYTLWGFLPAYWKLLSSASVLEVFTHRMFWSFVFMFIVSRFVRKLDTGSLFRDRRAVLILGIAGIDIALTWGIYIYAINNGHIIQASLGYYINPLVSILFGVVVFKERLTTVQKVATALAAAGVLYFTFDYGSFPWISVSLALLFAIYGALKKKGGYPATPALAVETSLVAPLALVAIIASFFLPGREFFAVDATPGSWTATLLLVGGGAVTAIPLLLFAKAANAIPLSWIGFLQYISPTITLLLGIFAYGETFTTAHVVCFSLIWLGLIMISAEMVRELRRPASPSD
ncbi:MAG: EamA family transporter RarD [Coriobacteriales bacterium]|nr:EamA family transporter RarD [Coriobacteriales bacterium]